MHRQYVESSSIASIAYDPCEMVLQVTFIRGAVYRYAPVPPERYAEFLAAPSKGAYFNRAIRTVYGYRKAGAE